MENKLSQWIGRILLGILAISLTGLLAFGGWKYLTFRAIISQILHPDWSEVTSITSYRMGSSIYTQYTEDNGREQAEQALESVRLGVYIPWRQVLSGGGFSTGCTVVELTMADGQRQRIAFYDDDQGSGYIRGQGELPLSYNCLALWELQANPALERTYHTPIFLVTDEAKQYTYPNYR